MCGVSLRLGELSPPGFLKNSNDSMEFTLHYGITRTDSLHSEPKECTNKLMKVLTQYTTQYTV